MADNFAELDNYSADPFGELDSYAPPKPSGTLGAYGQMLKQGVKGIPAYVNAAIEGDRPYTTLDRADEQIAQNALGQRAFIEGPNADAPVLGGLAKERDIRQGADSASGTLATLAPALAGSAYGSLFGPVGTVVGGLAGAGLGLYGMKRYDENRFIRENVEKANADRAAAGQPELSQPEAVALQDKLVATGDPQARGLWEAGSETLGTAAELAIALSPLKAAKLLKPIASPLARAALVGTGKALGIAGTEVGEEEVTRRGQNPIQAKYGLPEATAGETAKQTLIQMLPLAGAGGAVGSYQGYKYQPPSGPLTNAAAAAGVNTQPEVINEPQPTSPDEGQDGLLQGAGRPLPEATGGADTDLQGAGEIQNAAAGQPGVGPVFPPLANGADPNAVDSEPATGTGETVAGSTDSRPVPDSRAIKLGQDTYAADDFITEQMDSGLSHADAVRLFDDLFNAQNNNNNARTEAPLPGPGTARPGASGRPEPDARTTATASEADTTTGATPPGDLNVQPQTETATGTATGATESAQRNDSDVAEPAANPAAADATSERAGLRTAGTGLADDGAGLAEPPPGAGHPAAAGGVQPALTPFTPTHELSDGTKVVAVDDAGDTWRDKDGGEWRESDVRPLTPPPAAKPVKTQDAEKPVSTAAQTEPPAQATPQSPLENTLKRKVLSRQFNNRYPHDKEFAKKIVDSKLSGNIHLDDIGNQVELNQGKHIQYINNEKESGVIVTRTNAGEVLVKWDSDESAKHNHADAILSKRGEVIGYKPSWVLKAELNQYYFTNKKTPPALTEAQAVKQARKEAGQKAKAAGAPLGSTAMAKAMNDAEAKVKAEHGLAQAAETAQPPSAPDKSAVYHYTVGELGMTSSSAMTRDKSRWITFDHDYVSRLSGLADNRPYGATKAGLYTNAETGVSFKANETPTTKLAPDEQTHPAPKTENPAQTAGTQAGVAPAFVKVTDTHGTSHSVLKSELDSGRTMLKRFNRQGDKMDGLLHRDNIDADGAKRSEAWQDLPTIEGRGGKPFMTRKAAVDKIRLLGQKADDFEIKPVSGGFVGVRKSLLQAKQKADDEKATYQPGTRVDLTPSRTWPDAVVVKTEFINSMGLPVERVTVRQPDGKELQVNASEISRVLKPEAKAAEDKSDWEINRWEKIIVKPGGKERLRSYLISRSMGREFGEDAEAFYQRSGLTPFKDWARSALQNTPGAIPVKTESEAPEAAEKPTDVKPKVPPKTRFLAPPTGLEELQSAIKKLGGIIRAHADRAGFSDFKGRRYQLLFNNGVNSQPFDGMAEALRQYGYDVDGENALIEQLDSSLRGHGVYTPSGHEALLEVQQQERVNEETARHALRIESLLETAQQHDNDFGTPYYQTLLAKNDLSDEDIQAWEQDLHDDREDRHQESLRNSQAPSSGEAGLTGYTEQDLAEREREQKQRAKDAAQAELKAKQKAQADKEVEPKAEAEAPKAPETDRKDLAKSPEMTALDAEIDDVLGDIGRALMSRLSLKAAPEQNVDLLPLMSKLMGLAAKKGYLTFQENARYVLNLIREKFGDKIADTLDIDDLQGGYIAMKKGSTPKKDVVQFESIDDLLAPDPSAQTAAAPEPGDAIDFNASQAFAERLLKGESFKTIIQARKALTSQPIEPGTAAAKQADEAIELAGVLAGRRIIEQGLSAAATYDALVKLAEQMPSLNVRSSTSISEQAYSTPLPIAYVASVRAGITQNTTVLEPSAGNGALVMAAKPANVVANEFNKDRLTSLKAQGFDALNFDAAHYDFAGQEKKFKVVIANPPFGVVKGANGESLTFDISKEYKTNEIDHAIALNALKAMKDNGKAVLIVGGPAKTLSTEGRSDAYNGKAKRAFYYTLYNAYNVTDHFTVAGELYAKQGAAWPVDVIVIEGRGKSALRLPAADLPRLITNLAELKNELQDHRTGVPEDRTAAVQGDAGGTAGDHEAGGVRPATSRPDRPDQDGPPDGLLRRSGSGLEDDTGGLPGASAAGGNSATDRAAAGDRAPDKKAVTNAFQSPYQPGSSAAAIGTLVPVNMQGPIESALQAIKDEHGGIDAYVAGQLDYKPADIGRYFSAEQVDAIALALNNINNNKGFIIGDQTGVGKGRVNAAMIKYALLNKITPIFVTVQDNLYGDMIRDLNDIGVTGIKPLATNPGFSIPIDEAANEWCAEAEKAKENGDKAPPRYGEFISTPGSALHTKALMAMKADGDLGGYNVIFTTYSQMQTIKGESTARMDFLEAFGNGGLLILDESHNAGGTTLSARKGGNGAATVEEGAKGGRAGFTRKLVNISKGVFYSSATYAKRPDVLDLYAKTDMGLVADPEALKTSLMAGGVPLQQAVAAMLAKSGQYIRREKSFEGIDYATRVVEVDRQFAENASTIMRDIMRLDNLKKAAIKALDNDLKAGGRQLSGDRSTGGAGATSTNFTSVMHNMIGQMLLMLKVQPTIDEALSALKRGEKPVITLANTMGSAIDEYADDAGLNPGDAISLHFGDLLKRYLRKSRRVTEGNPFGKKESRYLTDAELGPAAVKFYQAIEKKIDGFHFDAYPISPIDAIHDALHKAGYQTGEITGRSSVIDYSGALPLYKKRSGSQKNAAGKRKTISDFNHGVIDAVILNQSGSTGLSLHSSPKVGKDTRKRYMILAQPEANIDTHMQMLGRVNRTGQTVLPAYAQMTANIPAEKRPSAILAKKMAMLNANTTGGKESAVKAKDTPDFMNAYGDEVAAALMNDNREIHQKLGKPLTESQTTGFDVEDAMRKVTGRIPVLPLKEQEALYAAIEDAYDEYIDMLNKTGQNQLEAAALKLDARLVETREVVAPLSQSASPFAQGVNAETVDVKRLGKPYTLDQVKELLAKRGITDDNSRAAWDGALTAKIEAAAAQAQAAIEALPEEDDKQAQVKRGQTDRLAQQAAAIKDTLARFGPGTSINLLSPNGAEYLGYVGNLERKGDAKNFFALGQWKLTVYVADAAKQFVLPLSRLSEGGDTGWALRAVSNKAVNEALAEGQSTTRERRVILTGNMLSAYGFNKSGQIISYTTDSGDTRQGVLMPRKFDLKTAIDAQPVIMTTPELAIGYLQQANDPALALRSAGNEARLIPQHKGHAVLYVPASKAKGGAIYLNRALTALTGDFYKSGHDMSAPIAQEKIPAVIRLLYPLTGPLQPVSKDRGKQFLADQGVKFSQAGNAATAANPHSKATLTAAITRVLDKQFGNGWTQALFQSGRFRVIDLNQARLLDAKAGDAKGFYNPGDKTTYLVANNLSKDMTDDEITGLLSHEIAVHALQLNKSAPEFQAILATIQRLKDAGNAKVLAAYARVPKKTKAHLVDEEALGYLIEAHPQLPIVRKLIAWLRKQIRALAKLFPVTTRFKFVQWAENLQPDDMIAMAREALRSAPMQLQDAAVHGNTAILQSAQAQGYKGEDTGEAKEWLRAKAKGLDMSREARMERAKAMGYTIKAFKAMYPYDNEGNLIATIKSTGAKNFPEYAGRHGGFSGFFSDSTEASNKFGMRGWASYPVILNMNNAITIDAKNKYAADFQFDDGTNNKNDLLKFESAIYDKSKGGVILKNTRDEGTVFVPSKPNQVRSINAAFDPDYQDSGNILASFAGAKSATANIHELNTAQERLAAGDNPEDVRQETGWHIGVDGKWRYEIDDSEAGLTADYENYKGQPWGVDKTLNHPKLFAAYPQLKKTLLFLSIADSYKGNGSYNPVRNEIIVNAPSEDAALSILLHELQHAVQNAEGFARGGSPTGSVYRQKGFANAQEFQAAITDLRKLAVKTQRDFEAKSQAKRYSGQVHETRNLLTQVNNLERKIKELETYDSAQAFSDYKRLYGEVEARNTQARMKMTARDRENMPPDLTQDTPDRQVIVVWHGQEMAMAPDNAETQGSLARHQLEQWANGRLPGGAIVKLGNPSALLQSFGMDELPIHLTTSVLNKAKNKHAVDPADLINLAAAVQRPIAIFASKQGDGHLVLVTELSHKEGNIVAALELNKLRDHFEVHDIRSLYPKNTDNIMRWIENGLLLGLEKTKGRQWLERDSESNSRRGQIKAALDRARLYEAREESNPQNNDIRYSRATPLSDSPLAQRLNTAAKKLGKLDEGILNEVSEHYGLFAKHLSTLDNLVRRNPDAKVKPFYDLGKDMQMEKDRLLSATNSAVKVYNDLGGGLRATARGLLDPEQGKTAMQKALDTALYEGTLATTVYGADELRDQFHLDDQAIAAYQSLRAYMDAMTDDYKTAILQRMGLNPDLSLIEPYTGNNPAKMLAAAEKIAAGKQVLKDFKTLKGYFPLMRFGDYTIAVKDSEGNLVYFAAEANTAKRNAHANRIKAQFDAGHQVSVGKLSNKAREDLAFDPRMLNLLGEYAEKVPGFAATFDEIEQKILRDFSSSAFKQRFIHRKGMEGFSRDTTRTLASYGWSSSNYLSKLQFVPKMQSFIDKMDRHKHPKLAEHFQATLDYIKTPREEFQAIKSFTFMYYMGFNVKSAAVNLTQIPTVLGPFLAAKFGDKAAFGAINRALVAAAKNPGGELGALLDWAQVEGLTMDAYLGELIGAASGSWGAKARLASQTLEAATLLFSHAERFNRRVSVAAAWQLVNGKSLAEINQLLAKAGYAEQDNKGDAIKEFAKLTVTKTQFDYGKFNRAAAFRGWASVPLQFHQYMLNYLQFISGNGGDKGAAIRSLGMILVFAGLMGAPGADDLRAALEYLYTKLTGLHVDIQQELRKALVEAASTFLDDDNARELAELALYGGFAQTPLDISGSLSAGRVVPGLADFFDTSKDKGELAGLSEGLQSASGAAVGIARKTLMGVEEYEKSGDVSRLAEKAVPNVAIQNLVKALRMGVQGVDRNYAGKVSVDYTPEAMDTIAQALSFTPGERKRLYRQKDSEYRESQFLILAHQKLLTRLAAATADKDPEAITEARSEIRAWNLNVPAKWRLTSEKVRRSMKARQKHFGITDDTGKGSMSKQLQASFAENRSFQPQ
ncbi:MAG: PLxRFG domain-containing protein [Candidatus Moranbacteria bacterium]|nr:PLxRFG domain-containing protein [Candidatus Moranbacteria bacterium]